MKEAPGQARRSSSSNVRRLIAAVDVDVVDGAIRADVAAEAQIRRIVGSVAKSAICTDAVRAVAIRRIAAATRETADPDHSVRARTHLRHAEHLTPRVRAEEGTEDSTDAGAVIESALNCRAALLRRRLSIHAVSVTVVIPVGISVRRSVRIARITVVLGCRRRGGG